MFTSETLSASVHSGQSSFELQIAAENKGVMLRRTLDLAFANQRARVYVHSCATAGEWVDAGVWFTAGSNTVVFSDPRNETGAPSAAEVVQTSNRRFRQEEFLLAAGLTTGCSSVSMRMAFEMVNTPLFPGRPFDQHGWSELGYEAYSYMVPTDLGVATNASEAAT